MSSDMALGPEVVLAKASLMNASVGVMTWSDQNRKKPNYTSIAHSWNIALRTF